MKVKRGLKGKKKESKTDRIASIFTARPFDEISPKDISKELGLEIQLVTSIVNRLRAEGMVDRVGWGKYKLKMDTSIEKQYLMDINRELREMASMILGNTSKFDDIKTDEDPFKELTELYRSIRELGGEAMASNLLRLCAKKSHLDDGVDILVESVGEVAEK